MHSAGQNLDRISAFRKAGMSIETDVSLAVAARALDIATHLVVTSILAGFALPSIQFTRPI